MMILHVFVFILKWLANQEDAIKNAQRVEQE